MARRGSSGSFTLVQTVDDLTYLGQDVNIDIERECDLSVSREEWGWDFSIDSDEATVTALTLTTDGDRNTVNRWPKADPALRAFVLDAVEKFCEKYPAEPPEENPRQRGDDDGVEYGDPREAW